MLEQSVYLSVGDRLSVVKFVAICAVIHIRLLCHAASKSWSSLASMSAEM